MDEFKHRYNAALHAMQSDVMHMMGLPDSQENSRNLERINSTKVEQAARVRMLIAKGLFTEAEYAEQMAIAMEQEVRRYEAELSHVYGMKACFCIGPQNGAPVCPCRMRTKPKKCASGSGGICSRKSASA